MKNQIIIHTIDKTITFQYEKAIVKSYNYIKIVNVAEIHTSPACIFYFINDNVATFFIFRKMLLKCDFNNQITIFSQSYYKDIFLNKKTIQEKEKIRKKLKNILLIKKYYEKKIELGLSIKEIISYDECKSDFEFYSLLVKSDIKKILFEVNL